MDRTSSIKSLLDENASKEPTKTGGALALEVLADGIKSGFNRRVQDVKESPVAFAAEMVGVGLASAALAAMRGKPAMNTVNKVLLGAGLGDAAYRVGTSGYAAVDTANHPEHYAANKQLIANTLGAAAFDYPTMALAGGLGVGAKALHGRLSTSPLVGPQEYSLQLTSLPRGHSKNVFEMAARTSNSETVRIPQYAFEAGGEKRPTWIEQRRDSPLAKFYEENRRSVVRINAEDGVGSGFFVDRDGLVATNYHVVRGAKTISIETSDKQTFFVKPIARDANADIALLRVIGKPAETTFPSATLAKNSELPKGAQLTAIGHPDGVESDVLSFGQMKGTVVKYANQFALDRTGTIATNIPIKPGFSGSAVFGENGSVIGVARATDGPAGYATSVEHLSTMLEAARQRQPITTWLDLSTYYEGLGNSAPRARIVSFAENSDATLLSSWAGSGRGSAMENGFFDGPREVLEFMYQTQRPMAAMATLNVTTMINTTAQRNWHD